MKPALNKKKPNRTAPKEFVAIYIDSRLSHADSLYVTLEKLYLAGGAYELVFATEMLAVIDPCFDRIIKLHGYREDIDFQYKIRD